MRLYDEIISDILFSLAGMECRKLPCGSDADSVRREWRDEGRAMMILSPDMAYELGGSGLPAIGNTLLTADNNLVPGDEITLVGKDLPEITGDSPYARIALVRVREDSVGEGNKLYNTIRNIGYFRYRIFPSGFMLRVSSSRGRESVRVSSDALHEGLDFTAVGNAMLKALHLYREVEAARIIFVTDPDVDYCAFADGVKKAGDITSAIDHMLKDVNMDCSSCGLQEVCDEVEELREIHFGISGNNV